MAINNSGYETYYCKKRKRHIFEHRKVWEDFYGDIPRDHEIHHKDGNKLNNDILNLECMSITEHKRVHAGHLLLDGIWHKRCSHCNEMLPYCDFYPHKERKGSDRTRRGECIKCSSIINKKNLHTIDPRETNGYIKTCNECNRDKPNTEFFKHGGGRQPKCKECFKVVYSKNSQ